MGKTIGIIAGTGLEENLFDIEGIKKIDGRVMPKQLTVFNYEGLEIVVITRHLTEGRFISPAQLILERGHQLNINSLIKRGVEEVYATNAVGTLDEGLGLVNDYDGGVFVIPNHLMCWETGPITMGKEAKTPHPNMAEPFNQKLRERLIKATRNADARPVDGGLYLSKGGDAFETDAEIHMLQLTTPRYPNRLLGMTAGPEAILAAQMEIPYATICSVANYGQGIGPQEEVTDDLVRERMDFAKKKMGRIFLELFQTYL